MKPAATSPDEVDYAKHFDQVRSQQAYVEDADASRKSSIDAHCRQLVDAINASPNYFTTSSCSGRFLAFAQAADAHVKQNCQWLSVSHDPLSDQQIGEFVALMATEQASYDQVFLKFEPFILHVCCRDLSYAKRMVQSSDFQISSLSFTLFCFLAGAGGC
jgi:tRNA wybutosine-synthesizing protein 3